MFYGKHCYVVVDGSSGARCGNVGKTPNKVRFGFDDKIYAHHDDFRVSLLSAFDKFGRGVTLECSFNLKANTESWLCGLLPKVILIGVE